MAANSRAKEAERRTRPPAAGLAPEVDVKCAPSLDAELRQRSYHVALELYWPWWRSPPGEVHLPLGRLVTLCGVDEQA